MKWCSLIGYPLTTKQSQFCEPELSGQYSNERSGANVETVRKFGERR